LYGGVGSFGDGAAMRAAPISAFFPLSNIEELAEEVNLCSVLTHTHSYGISGAVLQAVAVLLALNDVPVDSWMRTFFELNIESAYKIKLEDVERALRMKASPIEAARVVGNGSDALDAVPAAIYSVMVNHCNIPESILFAVAMGGDTDTIGAMAGAIAGAASGAENIPSDWFNNLENEKEGMGFIDALIRNVIKVG
ncbi:MAG: hypothetical protein GX640_01950, partial [Fibrobacter sp.]|nr:hypothetical protein [Fibrobacter sp.]